MIEASNKTKSIRIALIAIVILIVVIIISIQFYGNNKTIIGTKYSFSEMHSIDFTFENNEQNNIHALLDSLKIEDSYYYGFSNNTNITIDLYKSSIIVKTAKLMPGYNLAFLKHHLSFLSSTNIENLDFLNLTYYIELCLHLGIEMDYPRLMSALLKYYDKETNLFFIDSVENSISEKITATSIAKRILGNNLSHESFKLEDGIREVYASYDFQTKNEVTFYNSGGDILYCMSVFGMDGEINKERLNSWLIFWKDFYESYPVNSIMSALQYSEYLNVARVFEPNYSPKKLQDYYNVLTAKNVDNTDDIQILYNIIKNVELLNNTNANEAIKLSIEKAINNKELFQSSIDIKSTVCGVVLARKTDYPINEKKLQKFIQQNYIDIPAIENTYEKTSALYYIVILDQLVNGFEKKYDKIYLQSQVDEILKSLEYDQLLAADVISARRVVEIIMDLQIFDVDLQLTKAQRSRILKGLKKALKEDTTLKNTVIINDILLIDKALALNLVSDEEFIGVYNKLQSNGGVCALKDAEVEPDISTTYQFMVSLGRINNYENLNAQKAFVETLKVRDGLYKNAKNGDENYDLSVIVYANAIRYLEIGGSKDDSIK